MDTEDAGSTAGKEGLEPRFPHRGDLVAICRRLNELGAKYIIIGGFAIIASGMARTTGDMDILLDTSAENEALVFKALEILPDKAVLELDPGDVSKYGVVRVADEVTVDLMKAACGVEYSDAAGEVIVRDMDGVNIPFASPRLLWRMKAFTHREKDALDLIFLRDYFATTGERPPEV
jgi:hypothetical protein